MSRKGPRARIAGAGDSEEFHSHPSSDEDFRRADTHLEGVLDLLVAKYCPECSTRRPVDETVCPTDGTALRDVSITTDGGWGTTSLSLTVNTSLTSLAELFEGHTPLAQPGDDFLIAGVVLGGKWRLEKLVGEGTFGAFFLGRHATLGMQVGVKILRKRFTRTEAGRRLFHNEAMRLSLLHHPGIVQVLDYGEDGGRPYLVMEYLTGRPLHKYLGDESFTVDDGVEVVRQAAEALVAAHRGVGVGEPLVHLDLKPEHIFLEKIQGRWHVKVIDFGIAEIAAAPSDPAVGETAGKRPKHLAGTLPYMAPERWDGAVDARSDLYSLGIVLYELVAGRKPFDVWDAEAMRILHARERPTPPSRHRLWSREPGLRDLDAIVFRLLEKDPALRPQTAEELAETLERWQKRPRLTPGQRVARACMVPAAMVVLALGLVAWGPWEQISGVSKDMAPLLVGPNQPAQRSFYVSGMGYTGARAWLVAAAGAGQVEIELDPVAGGELKVDLRYAQLKEVGLEGEPECFVRIHGSLGRRLRSDPLKIRIDDQAPRVVTVNDGDSPAPRGRLSLLKGTSGEATVRVLADEPLDPALSRLNDKAPRQAESGRGGEDVLLFHLETVQTQAVLKLVDLAGNQWEGFWTIDWRSEHATRLLSLADRLTNDPNASVGLEWGEDPGDVTVTIEDAKPASQQLTAAKQNGRWRAAAAVPFDPDKAGAQAKTVLVRVEPRGDAPPLDESFVVRFLRRKLLVRPAATDAEGGLRVLEATTGDGVPLTQEELDWELSVEWRGGGGQSDFWFESHRGGRLTLDARKHLRGKRGKFRLQARVKDAFGNQSASFSLPFPFGVEKPRIRELKLQAQSVIHHEDCSLARTQEAIVIEFAVDYEYGVDDLVPKLWLGQAPPVGEEVVFEPSEKDPGRLTLSAARLREILREGPNQIVLVLTDPETGMRDEKSCSLIYEPRPDVAVQPDPGDPVATSELSLVVTPSGPRVASVAVKASGKPVLPAGEGSGFRVPVNAAARTEIAVRVDFEHGCHVTRPFLYFCAPREGWKYDLAPGSGGTSLELTHAKGGLWHTAPQPAATAEQAEQHAERLQDVLRTLFKPLGAGVEEAACRLATLEELGAVYSSRPPPGEALLWWVHPDPARAGGAAPAGFHSSAEWNERGFEAAREPSSKKLCSLVVLKLPGEISKRLASLAISARAEEEVSK